MFYRKVFSKPEICLGQAVLVKLLKFEVHIICKTARIKVGVICSMACFYGINELIYYSLLTITDT